MSPKPSKSASDKGKKVSIKKGRLKTKLIQKSKADSTRNVQSKLTDSPLNKSVIDITSSPEEGVKQVSKPKSILPPETLLYPIFPNSTPASSSSSSSSTSSSSKAKSVLSKPSSSSSSSSLLSSSSSSSIKASLSSKSPKISKKKKKNSPKKLVLVPTSSGSNNNSNNPSGQLQKKKSVFSVTPFHAVDNGHNNKDINNNKNNSNKKKQSSITSSSSISSKALMRVKDDKVVNKKANSVALTPVASSSKGSGLFPATSGEKTAKKKSSLSSSGSKQSSKSLPLSPGQGSTPLRISWKCIECKKALNKDMLKDGSMTRCGNTSVKKSNCSHAIHSSCIKPEDFKNKDGWYCPDCVLSCDHCKKVILKDQVAYRSCQRCKFTIHESKCHRAYNTEMDEFSIYDSSIFPAKMTSKEDPWFCYYCIVFDEEVEHILAHKPYGVDPMGPAAPIHATRLHYQTPDSLYVNELPEMFELFLRFKFRSYLRNAWAPSYWVKRVCPRLYQNYVKREVMEKNRVRLWGSNITEFPNQMAHTSVEKIIDVDDSADPVLYFVKWKDLDYEHCTWEHLGVCINSFLKPIKCQSEIFIFQDHFKQALTRFQDLKKLKSTKRKPMDTVFTPVSQLDFLQGGCLAPYQIHGVNWLLSNLVDKRNCILDDEPGLGKTVQSVAYIGCRFLLRGIGVGFEYTKNPILIIADISACRNWQRELEKWLPDLNVVLCTGKNRSRNLIWQKDMFFPNDKTHCRNHVIITSFDVIHGGNGHFNKIDWLSIIVDEETSCFAKLPKVFLHVEKLNVEHIVYLTKSPIDPERMEAVYPILSLLDKDKFGKNSVIFTVSDDEQIEDLVRPYILCRKRADVIIYIPWRKEYVVPIQTTSLQSIVTQQFVTHQFQLLKKKESSDDEELKARFNNILSQVRKCANHPYLFDKIENPAADKKTEYARLIGASGKMVFLEKLLFNLQELGRRVLILCRFTEMMDILQDYLTFKRYSYERVDDKTSQLNRINAFNRYNDFDSECFLFLMQTRCTIDSPALQADTIVFYDNDFESNLDNQAIKCVHRIGQSRDVLVYKLVAATTIEEDLFIRNEHTNRPLKNVVVKEARPYFGHSITKAKAKPNIITTNVFNYSKNRNKPKDDNQECYSHCAPEDLEILELDDAENILKLATFHLFQEQVDEMFTYDDAYMQNVVNFSVAGLEAKTHEGGLVSYRYSYEWPDNPSEDSLRDFWKDFIQQYNLQAMHTRSIKRKSAANTKEAPLAICLEEENDVNTFELPENHQEIFQVDNKYSTMDLHSKFVSELTKRFDQFSAEPIKRLGDWKMVRTGMEILTRVESLAQERRGILLHNNIETKKEIENLNIKHIDLTEKKTQLKVQRENEINETKKTAGLLAGLPVRLQSYDTALANINRELLAISNMCKTIKEQRNVVLMNTLFKEDELIHNVEKSFSRMKTLAFRECPTLFCEDEDITYTTPEMKGSKTSNSERTNKNDSFVENDDDNDNDDIFFDADTNSDAMDIDPPVVVPLVTTETPRAKEQEDSNFKPSIPLKDDKDSSSNSNNSNSSNSSNNNININNISNNNNNNNNNSADNHNNDNDCNRSNNSSKMNVDVDKTSSSVGLSDKCIVSNGYTNDSKEDINNNNNNNNIPLNNNNSISEKHDDASVSCPPSLQGEQPQQQEPSSRKTLPVIPASFSASDSVHSQSHLSPNKKDVDNNNNNNNKNNNNNNINSNNNKSNSQKQNINICNNDKENIINNNNTSLRIAKEKKNSKNVVNIDSDNNSNVNNVSKNTVVNLEKKDISSDTTTVSTAITTKDKVDDKKKDEIIALERLTLKRNANDQLDSDSVKGQSDTGNSKKRKKDNSSLDDQDINSFDDIVATSKASSDVSINSFDDSVAASKAISDANNLKSDAKVNNTSIESGGDDKNNIENESSVKVTKRRPRQRMPILSDGTSLDYLRLRKTLTVNYKNLKEVDWKKVARDLEIPESNATTLRAFTRLYLMKTIFLSPPAAKR